MAMRYKDRRRWALLLLLIGLPLYVVVAITVINLLERPGVLLELAIYLGLGIVWALPFKFIFKGIGQAPPDQE